MLTEMFLRCSILPESTSTHALQRSAFTYCDDERPSRVDCAKSRYGGPFTTEQVEDVKAFLRILILLHSLGATFVMEVPTTFITFGLLAIEKIYQPL